MTTLDDQNIAVTLTISDANQKQLKQTTETISGALSLQNILGMIQQECNSFVFEQLNLGNFPNAGSIVFGFPAVWPIQV
jgi:hypothetical protein